MLTYEHFVALLLAAIERADLNIAYTQELLDTHALGRSLNITCLPRGAEDDQNPEEPALRASMGFRWSPEFTVFSLRGSIPAGFEEIVDERILATQAGIGLDIDVSYTLPLPQAQERDLASLPHLARSLQELYASVVPDGERSPRVDVLCSFGPAQSPRILALTLQQTWPIGDALFDTELLSGIFDDLCTELGDFLETLADIYLVEPNETTSPPEEAPDEERRYFKPPTA